MNFDCKKCKMFDVCEMTKELGFMNGGCRAYTEKKPLINYDHLVSMTMNEMALWFAKTFGDERDFNMWMEFLCASADEEGE